MKLRIAISSLALAAALGVGGSAFAQTVINGVEVPADQLAAIQEKCTALSTASLASDPDDNADSDSNNDNDDDGGDDGGDGGDDGGDGGDDGGDDGDDGNDDESAAGDPGDGAENDTGPSTTIPGLDIDGITLDQCREAGLVD